jgi:hypothetical protein
MVNDMVIYKDPQPAFRYILTKVGYRPQPKICEKLPAPIILAKPFLVLIYKTDETFSCFFTAFQE